MYADALCRIKWPPNKKAAVLLERRILLAGPVTGNCGYGPDAKIGPPFPIKNTRITITSFILY